MSRTIKNLTELNGVVYVYLSDSATGKRFLEDAEKEGFTFGDGAKPTSRDYAMVMAVHPDNTLNYVGAVGNAAFDMADKIGDKVLYRIDYAAYITGADNYYYSK